MDSLLAGLAQHAYTILFSAVFLETIGFPVPAAIAPLIAVYLYCTCIRDATSARVAKELIDQGVKVAMIEGGE